MSRRWIVLAVLLLVALGAWWTMREPFDEDQLFRAVPAEATFVTAHRDLGARAEVLVTNPVTRAGIRAAADTGPEPLFRIRRKASTFGGKLQEVLGLRRRGATQVEEWLRLYSPRETVFALAPAAADTPPRWFAVSHLGARMHVMRPVAGSAMEEVGEHDGATMYRLGEAVVALRDGLLLAASDPSALARSLDCLAGHSPSLSRDLAPRVELLRAFGGEHPDIGLWSLEGLGELPYRITELSPDRIVGDAVLPPDQVDTPILDATMDDLGRLYGDHPMALVAGSPAPVFSLLRNVAGTEVPAWLAGLRGPASVAVVGGEFASSYFTLPSVVVTAELAAPAEGEQALAAFAAAGPSRQVATNGRTFVELETPLNRGGGTTAYKDRLSATVQGARLYVGTSTKVLDRLLQRLGTSEAEFERGHGRWLREYRQESTRLFAWIDSRALGGKLDVALAAAGVSLNLSVKETDQRRKQALERVRTVIQGAKALHTLTLRHREEDGRDVLHFEGG